MNIPTVPHSRTQPAAESVTIPQSRSKPTAESSNSDPKSTRKRASSLSLRRYATVVRQTAWRLTSTVREATADGSLGSAEISRMHMWVTADLVPWAIESVEQVDDVAKRQALAIVAEVKRLDAELSASIGTSAADIAEQLRKQGSALVRILAADD